MEISQGFAPVADQGARILILGSMPGIASLEATEYYAFGRNAFWKIMGELFGAKRHLDYRTRLQTLMNNHIALWDVGHACHRPGSLDSAISEEGLGINDFNGFLKQFPDITHICFNGLKAADLFKKKVQPTLEREITFHSLPSTSPAYAAMNYAAKLEAWSIIKSF
jgi:hypoxanthine-DNA glycosylase